MQVTFELTPDDFWHFNLYYRRHKHPIRPFFIYSLAAMMSIVFLGGIWVVADFWLRRHQLQWTMLFYLAAMAFFIPRFLPRSKAHMIRLASRRPGLLCGHTVSISPEWLAEKTEVNDTKVSWSTLNAIEEDGDYLYLFVTKAVAHTIPKRAFTSLAEAQTFMDRSRRYWQAAKTGQPVPADDCDIWPPPPRIGA